MNHSKLIMKLHSCGIRSATLRWIQDFLGNRLQKVVVAGEESDSFPVTSGVPQGSVLGPILFLVYINDLPDDIVSQVRLFADNTAIYLILENKSDSNKLQRDLDRLQACEARRDMEFKPSKCQVVRVTSSRTSPDAVYTAWTAAGGCQQRQILGMDISSNLSWSTHEDRITVNPNSSLGFIKRNIKTKSP